MPLDNDRSVCYAIFNMKKEFTIKKIEQPKPKGHKLLVTKIILLFILVGMSAYGAFQFYNTHDFRSPVLFQNPFPSKQKEVIVSPVGKKKQTGIIDVGKIADRIYTLESSNGRNDSCKKIGKVNGFGYRQNTFEWICYDSYEEVRGLVVNWLLDHIGKYGVERSLCIYNRGVNETGCNYAINYKSL